MPKAWGNVRVVVRVRPCLPREVDAAGQAVSCVGVDDSTGRVYLAADKTAGPVIVDTHAGDAPAAGVVEYAYDRALRGGCSEDNVYEGPVRDAVDAVAEGFNAAVFAYGQSGAGKTHTITHLLPRVIRRLLDSVDSGECAGAGDADGAAAAAQPPPLLSVYQVYNEVIMDLLDDTTPTLTLAPPRDACDDTAPVLGALQREFRSIDEALRLVAAAVQRRAVGATCLNDVSSRSHLVIQVSMEGRDGAGSGGKLNLVDLAGSERLKQSRATGDRLTEAKAINLSLFSLVNVVRHLVEKAKHVPYRASKLTHALRDSLGGDSKTVLIAAVSPVVEALGETKGTLTFATAWGKVVNTPKKRVPVAPMPRPAPQKPKKRVAPWEGETPEYKRSTLRPWLGGLQERVEISVLQPPGTCPAGWDAIVLLHGCPSNAAAWTPWFPVLRYCKVWPVAIDMPGFGSSPGTRHRSRSEFNDDAGGPVDVACGVMDALGIRRAHVMGYDWGGGAVLSLALRHPFRCLSVAALMPSYQEQRKGQLKGMVPPVLVAWVLDDQFHSWKKWQPLARSMSKVTIATEKTRAVSYALELPVVRFLTGTDPFATAAPAKEAKQTAAVTTSGAAMTLVHSVALKRDLSDAEAACPTAAGGGTVPAVDAFHAWHAPLSRDDIAAQFRQCVADKGVPCLKIFAALPTITPGNVADGSGLVGLGLWPATALANRDALPALTAQIHTRYPRGRRVLVRLGRRCLDTDFTSPSYMHHTGASGAGGDEGFVTHLAVVHEHLPAQRAFAVDVPHVDGGAGTVRVTVDERSMALLNDAHKFSKTCGSGREYYSFEDGMRGAYCNPLVKGKVAHIAAALAPMVARLDFASAECLAVQRACVETVRGLLNTTVFADGLDRGRVSRTDDLGKIAAYGQVQCHGGSSVLAFFLLPFATALGIELKYRGGYTFGPGHTPQDRYAVNAPETHQWLEVTYQPSGETCVCDVFLKRMNWRIADAYTRMMYPNGRLICGTRVRGAER